MKLNRVSLGALLAQGSVVIGIAAGLAFGACPQGYDTCQQQGITSCASRHYSQVCDNYDDNGVSKCCCYNYWHY